MGFAIPSIWLKPSTRCKAMTECAAMEDGQRAYEAYNDHIFYHVQDRDIGPPWEELSDTTKAAWAAAERTVIDWWERNSD